MKTQQQQQAYEQFMQSNTTKTEIAEKLGVNRRTIYQWSVDGDWEILRASARCMPSILAQKCYHLIGHFTDHILSRDAAYQSITKDETNILAKLVNMVTKLKNGSTTSENMETFTLFMEGLQQKDPFLAHELQPHVETFVTEGGTKTHKSFILDGFNKDGTKPFPEKDLTEKWQDEKDYDAILDEINSLGSQATHPTETTAPAPEADAPAIAEEATADASKYTRKGYEFSINNNEPTTENTTAPAPKPALTSTPTRPTHTPKKIFSRLNPHGR